MGKLNILPSQRGKLPSEPDYSRFFGLEFEFDPDGVNMGAYRIGLYEHGIDTFDDGCEYISARRGGGGNFPDPARLRSDPPCDHREGGRNNCGPIPRATHILNTLNFARSSRRIREYIRENGFTEVVRNEIEDELEEAEDSTSALLNLPSSSVAEVLALIFERIERSGARFWDLGTDPTAGYELRTTPIRLEDDAFRLVEDTCDALRAEGAVATSSCGLHIHQDFANEDAEVAGRVAAIYRLVEPLLAAPVDPSRYFNGYNNPAWQGSSIDGKQIKDAMSDKNQARRLSSQWLNTGQLRPHNSMEFRGLEGTLDPAVVNNYTLLLNRFIQAVKLDEGWGVKLRGVAPIGVSHESIHAFFKYLDLVRSDLDDDLKEMREWYIERVRQFRERNAFRNSLITGSHERTEDFVELRDLRERGTHKGRTLFEEVMPEEEEEEPSDKEVGLRIYQAIEETILNSRTNTRNGVVRWTQVMEPMLDAPEEFGVEREVEAGRPHIQTRFSWYSEDSWEEFHDAVAARDFEAIGSWFKTYIEDEEPSVQDQRTTGLAHLVQFWVSMWARSVPDTAAVENFFKGEDSECVVF